MASQRWEARKAGKSVATPPARTSVGAGAAAEAQPEPTYVPMNKCVNQSVILCQPSVRQSPLGSCLLFLFVLAATDVEHRELQPFGRSFSCAGTEHSQHDLRWLPD